MNQTYRDTVRKLEQLQVDPEYLLGWQSGFLGHPPREEQRVNEAWQHGELRQINGRRPGGDGQVCADLLDLLAFDDNDLIGGRRSGLRVNQASRLDGRDCSGLR